jgi:hypothetical protein
MESTIRLAVLVCCTTASFGHASVYELNLHRLGNPRAGGTSYSAQADGNFRVFARQLGAALTSSNLTAPVTLGVLGFAVSPEISFIDLPGDPLPLSAEWKGMLRLPSLHVRKGLPWSFEIGARGAWIEQTRMGAATIELLWAVNEGFSHLPNVAIRASLTRLINGGDLDLTAGGADLSIGKQFVVADTMTVTPYAGGHLVFVAASSGIVDFKPNRSNKEADQSQASFEDYGGFLPLSADANSHFRFFGGARAQSNGVYLGLELSYSVLGRFKDQTTQANRDVPSVFAVSSALGFTL